MELWDVLDRQGRATGKTIVRGTPLRSGQYHLVVHIWLVDPQGNLLIQRRAENRYPMPGVWAATGGSALVGEDSRTAVCRELSEELGITCDPEQPELVSRYRRRNAFVDCWLLRVPENIPVDELALQTEEVAEARWVTPEQLREDIRDGKFHHYGNDYFENLFARLESDSPVCPQP